MKFRFKKNNINRFAIPLVLLVIFMVLGIVTYVFINKAVELRTVPADDQQLARKTQTIQSSLQVYDVSTSEIIKKGEKNSSGLSEEGIVIGKKFEGIFDKKGEYSYQIDKDMTIAFVSRQNPKSSNSVSNWAGDVILRRGDNNSNLLENIAIEGPSGSDFSVLTTSDPNILLLRRSDGDMGGTIVQDYYLDLIKNKIIFRVSFVRGGGIYWLAVQKDDLPEVKLDLLANGKCEVTGQKIQIFDIAINGKAANILKNPIEINCVDGAFGAQPDLGPDMVQKKIENDFSKFHFVLVGQIRNGVATEIWSHEFYIPFNDPNTVKIFWEN